MKVQYNIVGFSSNEKNRRRQLDFFNILMYLRGSLLELFEEDMTLKIIWKRAGEQKDGLTQWS